MTNEQLVLEVLDKAIDLAIDTFIRDAGYTDDAEVAEIVMLVNYTISDAICDIKCDVYDAIEAYKDDEPDAIQVDSPRVEAYKARVAQNKDAQADSLTAAFRKALDT